MELFRASKVCLTLRQFYLCQAEVFGPSPAHEGALFEITHTVPEVTVEVSISSSTSTGLDENHDFLNPRILSKNLYFTTAKIKIVQLNCYLTIN